MSSALISVLVAAVVLVGVLFYFFGKRSWFERAETGTDEAAPCAKDIACAGRVAKKLETVAHEGELRPFALALEAAYDRRDCALAAELVEGAGRAPNSDARIADARRAMTTAHFGACGDKREQPPNPPVDAKITIEHAKCSGACAAYIATLRGDGKLDWDGKANVASPGKAEGHVDRSSARELFDLLERVHFTKLESEYLSQSNDPELVRVTLERGSVRHSVLIDAPCRTPAAIGAGLCYVSSRIDELMGTGRYVSGPK